jgi:integrase
VYATRLTIDTHITPRLGAQRLTDIKTRDISAWIADLARDGRRDRRGGLAPKTIRNTYAVLASILGDAAANDLIARNPCDGVRLPRVERPILRVWDRWQLAQFLASARDANDPMYPIWRLIGDTGMRRGEVLGLTWDHIDTVAYEIEIAATRVTVGGRMIESEPKTRAGRRRITVAADTIDALARLREAQDAMAKRLEMPPMRYVCAFDDGRPMSRAAFARRWAVSVKRAGVPYASPHKARHTVPTVMLEDGAPIHIVAGRMGHASGAVTLGMYAEYLPSADRDAATAWGNALGDAMRDATVCAECVPTMPKLATLADTHTHN